MRVQTFHRTSDGREFGGHEFQKAQEWQRYLNKVAHGVPAEPPDLTSVPDGPQVRAT